MPWSTHVKSSFQISSADHQIRFFLSRLVDHLPESANSSPRCLFFINQTGRLNLSLESIYLHISLYKNMVLTHDPQFWDDIYFILKLQTFCLLSLVNQLSFIFIKLPFLPCQHVLFWPPFFNLTSLRKTLYRQISRFAVLNCLRAFTISYRLT